MAENILSGMFPVVFTGQASSTVDHKLRSGNGFAPDRIKKNYGLPDFLRGTPPLYRYSAVSGFFLSHSGISCVSAVSYTHLDVYKRQGLDSRGNGKRALEENLQRSHRR